MTPVAGAVQEKAEAESGPGEGSAGLGARLEVALTALSSVVSDLDPARLTGADATKVYGSLVDLERLCNAGKTLLAPRIDEAGVWRDEGHRSAAVMLASLEGVTTGQAQNTLVNGQRLEQLPGTEAALRAGELSGPKVTQLTGAGILAPEREAELLAGAEEAPLHEVKERCRRSRATSGTEDPKAQVIRIRKDRHFSSWTDKEGAFCFQGRDTADRGAQILDSINQVALRLRKGRQAAGDEREDPGRERAVRADAFYALVTRRHPDSGIPLSSRFGAGTDSGSGSGTGEDTTRPDADADADGDGDGRWRWRSGAVITDTETTATNGRQPEDPSFLIDGPPPCSVIVRVDVDALRRGRARR